jgi:hypothetical protein
MTICAQTTWFVGASLAFRLHRRLTAVPRGAEFDQYMEETKRIGDELTNACRTAVCPPPCWKSFADPQNKKDKYGVTMAQLLEYVVYHSNVFADM